MKESSPEAYRQAVRGYLREVLLRPPMYFGVLKDLEYTLHGHAVAYMELGHIERSERFNQAFGDWIWETKHASACSGWALAVTGLAETAGEEELVTLGRLTEDFFEVWGREG